jgi:WD40 repeat protein
LFAVANGLLIQVFSFYTAECPLNMVFKGHSGKIKSIVWSDNDTSFASTGIDGSVFEWRLHSKQADLQHIQDFFQKGTCFNDLIYT